MPLLQQIPMDLRDSREIQVLSEENKYTRTLGIEWNVVTDQFRILVADSSLFGELTKRKVISDISKVFDVLGFFAPATIKMKILLQRLWEIKLDWDEAVPEEVKNVWCRWRTELPSLTSVPIPRCYLPCGSPVAHLELHGFCDAS